MKTVSWATKNEVVGRLRMAGLSMKDFALVEGYRPNTVRKVVSRYAGSKRTPRGALAREILRKLGRELRMLGVGWEDKERVGQGESFDAKVPF